MKTALLLLTVLCLAQASEPPSFTVSFRDVETATGLGFDDPDLGTARRETLLSVLDYLGEVLGEFGRLEIEVRSAAVPGVDDPVAVGRPFFDADSGLTRGHPYRHLVALSDPCRLDNCGQDLADMEIVVDFSRSFHTGEGAPDAESYDLFSVLLSEMLHGLGVYSLTAEDGGSSADAGTLLRYDALLQTDDGLPLRDGTGQFLQDTTVLTDGAIRFGGQRAALVLGRAPELVSGAPFRQGISLQRWVAGIDDEAVGIDPFPTGSARRQLALFELAALDDLGYTLDEATALVFPWISNSNEFTSTLVLNNPGSVAIRVALTATRADGSRATARRTLPARGFLREEADSLFPTLGRGPGATVFAFGDRAGMLGRWVTADRPEGVPSQGIAIPLPNDGSTNERLGTALNFGFLPGDPAFIAAGVLVNTASEAADVDVYRFGEEGTLAESFQVTDIQPFRPHILLVTGTDSGASQLVVQSDGAALTGVVFVFTDEGQTATGNAEAIQRFTPPEQP